jgi:predicted acyltransferase
MDDAAPRPERLAALDLFRGATVAAMLFVNNPGDWGHVLAPFGHAEWHGWTPTDLIFPFFLFIVGTAGVLSLEKRGWYWKV